MDIIWGIESDRLICYWVLTPSGFLVNHRWWVFLLNNFTMFLPLCSTDKKYVIMSYDSVTQSMLSWWVNALVYSKPIKVNTKLCSLLHILWSQALEYVNMYELRAWPWWICFSHCLGLCWCMLVIRLINSCLHILAWKIIVIKTAVKKSFLGH